MNHKKILEMFSRECVAGDAATVDWLRDTAAKYSDNPAAAIKTFQQLQTRNLREFTLAAISLLGSAEEELPGFDYLAGFLVSGTPLIDLLLDERALDLETGLALAGGLAAEEPLLDVRVLQRLMAKAEGDVSSINPEVALRALALVDTLSDCSRVALYMVQLTRHPSEHVRSKATLLLGRSNLNLPRVKVLLDSEDNRVSANAVESLWGRREKGVRELLWKATKHAHGRVVVNALLELYRCGEREAYSQLVRLSGAADPALRSSAAWGMGETGDPEFSELLEKLANDGDAKVRVMAEKSRKKLRVAEPCEPAQVAAPQVA